MPREKSDSTRGTTQIWVVTRHQHGISALVSQKSFCGETSGSVAKCRLFSQASVTLVQRNGQREPLAKVNADSRNGIALSRRICPLEFFYRVFELQNKIRTAKCDMYTCVLQMKPPFESYALFYYMTCVKPRADQWVACG